MSEKHNQTEAQLKFFDENSSGRQGHWRPLLLMD